MIETYFDNVIDAQVLSELVPLVYDLHQATRPDNRVGGVAWFIHQQLYNEICYEVEQLLTKQRRPIAETNNSESSQKRLIKITTTFMGQKGETIMLNC